MCVCVRVCVCVCEGVCMCRRVCVQRNGINILYASCVSELLKLTRYGMNIK